MAAPKLQNARAPGIVPAHTMYGSAVTATVKENNTGSNVGPATWSTAPYIAPETRRDGKPRAGLCGVDGCRAYPATGRGFDVCIGHARSAGLVATCSAEGCNKAAPEGAENCAKHQENHDDAD